MPSLDWIRDFVKAPYETLCLIFGCILIVLSFSTFSYSEHLAIHFTKSPNWYLFVPGILLLFFTFYKRSISEYGPSGLRLSKIERGVQVDVSSGQKINVIIGAIQGVVPGTPHAAVVLPANTCFDDECIYDPRSALGAYFQRYFPHNIDRIQSLIQENVKKLKEKGIAQSNGEFTPGTTIFLAKPLDSEHSIIIVGVTKYTVEGGITADTQSITASVRAVFKEAAINRISNLFIPVLGTGHGGLDFQIALALLIMQGIHCMKKEGFHHVKDLTILVFDPKGNRRKLMERVVKSVAAFS